MAFRVLRLTDGKVRRWWADTSITTRTCRARTGIAYSTLSERAGKLGLGPKPNPAPVQEQVDVAAFTALWQGGWSAKIIAERLGLYRDAVKVIAARLGLPPRPFNFKRGRLQADAPAPRFVDVGLITDLWRLNVSLEGIGQAMGSNRSVAGYTVKRLQLPPRVPLRGLRLTLDQGRALLAQEALLAQMRADSRAITERWRAAEMASGRTKYTSSKEAA